MVFLSSTRRNGGCDWNTGVPAYNIVASAMSALLLSNHNGLFVLRTHAGGDACVPVNWRRHYFHCRIIIAFSCFALMQAKDACGPVAAAIITIT